MYVVGPIAVLCAYLFQVTFATSVSAAARPQITLKAATGVGHTVPPELDTDFQATMIADPLRRLQLETAYKNGNSEDLLRGEADGAMFSQFDASPGLQTTVVSSDNVANNNRDGQNSRYLLDLDPAAVTGNFTVLVQTPGNELGVAVVISPVYYPNNGPVNPNATVKAIYDALSSLPIVGINWPGIPVFPPGYVIQGIPGPTVDVRLVSAADLNTNPSDLSGELVGLQGTPWDPSTNGISTSFYVYEITFAGELHDTQIRRLHGRRASWRRRPTRRPTEFDVHRYGTTPIPSGEIHAR